MSNIRRSHMLNVGIIIALIMLFFILPPYHVGNLSRIMVLAVYAMGFNLLFGYTGLLSLGHALFFASGMYGLGLAMNLFAVSAEPALFIALFSSLIISAAIGMLSLRTSGVAFMIVTLMFAQTGYLSILYFGAYTRGDEGFIIQQADRMLVGIDVTGESARYFTALFLFSGIFLASAYLIRSPFGRILIAIRENEDRTKMLGYNTARHKLLAIIISGTISGLAGAVYALLFGYVGASFATVQYSIFPLLWVLLGGAGTIIGPLIGTAFMFYLIDLSSSVTQAYLLIAGIVLVLLTLFAPLGLAGELRKRWVKWML